MKGFEEFFGKLQQGGDSGKGLNSKLEETGNILAKILKLENKEADKAELDRKEADTLRKREVRAQKRKRFDLQNPFTDLKKETEEEKKKGKWR